MIASSSSPSSSSVWLSSSVVGIMIFLVLCFEIYGCDIWSEYIYISPAMKLMTKTSHQFLQIKATPLHVIFFMMTSPNIIKWKHFSRYWPFVRALMFSLICAWINNWVNNREASDLRCHRANYDVTVMFTVFTNGTYVCRWCMNIPWTVTYMTSNVSHSLGPPAIIPLRPDIHRPDVFTVAANVLASSWHQAISNYHGDFTRTTVSHESF